MKRWIFLLLLSGCSSYDGAYQEGFRDCYFHLSSPDIPLRVIQGDGYKVIILIRQDEEEISINPFEQRI